MKAIPHTRKRRIHHALLIEELEPRISPATFTVTNLNGSGEGSLRQAVLYANAVVGADDIVFQDGLNGTITLTTAQLTIIDDLTITGPGASSLTISGDNSRQVFYVDDSSPTTNIAVTISGLTLTNGSANYGGAIYNAADLTVQGCIISGNFAEWYGGGIYNESGMLTVDASVIRANTAEWYGGGIYNCTGTLNVQNGSMIGGAGAGNSTTDYGGGIYNDAGMLTVDASVISANTADWGGGGIYNYTGTLNVQNDSVIGGAGAGNSTTHSGGGIYSDSGTVTLDGSTFIGNSAGYDGGGIYSSDATTDVTGCTFSGNQSARGGGGASSNDSVFTATNCTFLSNIADGGGGGMDVCGGSLTATDCTFTGNTAGGIGMGGGMCTNEASVALVGCTFRANTAGGPGGGMANIFSLDAIVTRCTFVGNAAGAEGGGICNDAMSVMTVSDCAFIGNRTQACGGGMANLDSSPVLVNCLFASNVAEGGGGGMDNLVASPTLMNCVLTGNTADTWGGGINNVDSSPVLTNCILWENEALLYDPEISNGSSTPVISFCDIQGCGGSGAGWDALLGTDGGGNIDDNPLFVDASDPDGTDDIPGTVDDGLRPMEGSPCIDAGTAAGAPATDVMGVTRPQGGGVDIGAYEFVAVIYVDKDATAGANNGTSWADAYLDLQSALSAAPYGAEIWVAEGTYLPTAAADRTATFQLAPGVGIYGGFDGTEGMRSERDYVAHVTILSGDIGVTGTATDNSYHVVTGSDGAALDGFTITGGYANGWPSDNDGAGMYNSFASPAVANCIFTGNYTKWRGGGMYNDNSDPVVANCTFSANVTDHYSTSGGAAIYNSNSDPIVANCTFSANSAFHGGAMLNSSSSSPVLTNCTFSANSATLGGGAIDNSLSSSPTFTNCTFSGNSAGTWGGAVSDSSSSPTLTNCTFSANSANNGGAMYNDHSLPTLSDCTFSGNSAAGGGAMDNLYSSPMLADCVFFGNSTTSSGAAMSNYNSSPTLTNCTFLGNSTPSFGAAMHNSNSSPILTNCAFSGNSAGRGGAMDNSFSSPTLTNCTFSSNSVDYFGGAMENSFCSLVLTNCTFSGNSAGYSGGAMHNSFSSLVLSNCTFSGNSGGYGGAMYNSSSSPTLTNCTLSTNSAAAGGATYNTYYSSPTLTNCILWGDTASSSGDEIYNCSTCYPTISWCDIEGCGGSGAGWDAALGTDGGGNMDADPLFMDAGSPAGPDGILGTVDDGVRLGPSSPVIDTGTDVGAPATDILGIPRPLGGNDRGAYEFLGVIYVDIDATAGANNGTSWADAYTDLQTALGAALWGQDIWVAEGTYLPTTAADRTATFQLVSGVGVYGGFDATESLRGERDTVTHVTILSGDLNGDDVGFTNNGENVYHVVTGADGAVVDGFTISGGNANGGGTANSGGGIYNDNASPVVAHCTLEQNAAFLGAGLYNTASSPTIANCFFTDNAATTGGGGIYNINASSPTILDCTFAQNTSDGSGGGLYSEECSPVLTRCTFDQNQSQFTGGGMTSYGGSPRLVDCVFTQNVAGTGGGGMANAGLATPILDSCLFSGNTAEDGAGMDNCDAAFPTLVNCTFTQNTAAEYGGGMRNNDSSSPTVTNCTFDQNMAQFGGAISNAIASSPLATDCLFTHNTASSLGGGVYDSGTCTPVFTGCTFLENTAVSGGAMCNDAPSPVLDKCAFAGNVASSNGGALCNDLSSAPTIVNCVFLANTAGQGGGVYNTDSAPVLINCVFAANTAQLTGGAMRNDLSSAPTLTNCVLWSDSAAMLGPEIYNTGGSVPVISYCDIDGCGSSGGGWDGTLGADGGGNIDLNPMFVNPSDPDGTDDQFGTADDGLRLQNGSMCIDAGTATGAPATDIVGIARPHKVGFDMGAYENDNDLPTLSGLAAAVSFDENTVNAAGQVIDSDVTFDDPDGGDLGDGRLTVTYSVGGGAENLLSIWNEGTGAGMIGVSGSTVSYEGVAFGTISSDGANGADLIVIFDTNSTVAAIDALIEHLTYANTSDNPTADRTIRITFDDGDGGASTPQTCTITVTAENDGGLIALLTDDPDPVYRPFQLTLTASGVVDPDVGGTVTAVEFYVDENANNAVDVGIDTFLGNGTDAGGGTWTWTGYTFDVTAGSHTYLARAQDDQATWGEAATTTGDVAAIATVEVVPGQVILYDTDVGDAPDISAADVIVKLNKKDGSVKSVTMVGNPTGLGILVNSIGAGPVTIKDARKTKTFPVLEEISFVVCMGPVKQLSLKSPIAGWNVGPVLQDEGWVLDADLDGDGDTDDLTAVYCGAPTKRVKVLGRVGGDVVVADADAKFVGLGKLDVKNGNILGEVVTLDGGLKALSLKGGNLLGNVIVSGDLGKVSVKAGKDATGAPIGGTIDGVDILVSGLAKGIAADAITGSLIAALNIGKVTVKGNLADSRLHAGGKVDRDHNWVVEGHGNIKSVTVKGDMADCDITAGVWLGADGVWGTDDTVVAPDPLGILTSIISKVSVTGLITWTQKRGILAATDVASVQAKADELSVKSENLPYQDGDLLIDAGGGW